ncbi:MAG: TonB-dependent receptor [Methylocystis sp.]|nr:MAG: TonB-dependent receptor [Methylocystis sp.]
MTRLLTVLSVFAILCAPGAPAEARKRFHPPAQPRIEADDDSGYFSDYVTGPGGRKTRTEDIPGATTVLTRKMLDDLNPRNACDALRYAPGVFVTGCW